MRVDYLCEHATSVCCEVAKRDLGDTPLYIVPYSRLEHYPEKNLCAGFTNPSLDLFVKDHIPDWRGRGPCIVIDELPLRLRRFDYDLDFVAVALHELAHILQRDVLYRERPNVTPEVIQAESDRLAALVSNEAALLHKNLANPLTDHNGEYLRIAFHLLHRAVAIGQPLAANTIIDTTAYGLSASECYADAIAEEAARTRDATFREILATKFPEEFSRLWTADVVRWFHSQPDKEVEAT